MFPPKVIRLKDLRATFHIPLKNIIGEKNIEEVEKYLHPQVEFYGSLATLKGKEAVLKATINFMNMFENSILEKTDIQLATNQEQILACFPVMRQLRPHLSSEKAFVEQVQRQLKEGYHLAYILEGGNVRAVAGFRFLEFLAWGKVIYIDDLVADAGERKKGYGTKLLNWIINEAKKAGCDQVHLDSGPNRHDAHRLYLNNGFKIIGHHFALDLKTVEQ